MAKIPRPVFLTLFFSSCQRCSAAPPLLPTMSTDLAPHASPAYDDVPIPKSLDELVGLLHAELVDGGLDSDSVDVNRVQRLMENYCSNETDWHKYAHFDPYRYTRNLVDDGNGHFNLLVLCWGAGHQSAIHDHSGSHCIMKILDGELTETLYSWPSSPQDSHDYQESEADSALPCPKCGTTDCPTAIKNSSSEKMRIVNQTTFKRDGVTYIHDKIGLHRVSNPSREKPAVSLHLYTPKFDTCRTFNERTGVARATSTNVFFSKKGEKVSYRNMLQQSIAQNNSSSS
ncbi:uncharacterized protein VTP21DRAFT_4662 [Calcarisporiella thermophila]|uniref:uncharacterized protein n=1 Tax=Calcarisporiella thermophila TaxID=911321 RepID=UPI0037438943